MPAIFVADERGPLEPNLYVALSSGRPNIDLNSRLPDDVKNFLNEIWKRFGHMATEQVISKSKENSAYNTALNRGRRSEILFSEMRTAFTNARNRAKFMTSEPVKAYQSQSGRTVSIKKWNPGQKA